MSTTPPPPPSPGPTVSSADALAWAVVGLGGALLATSGFLQALQGVAVVGKGEMIVTGATYFADLDLTTWGWLHIGIGAVAFAVGVALLAGARWARVAGILMVLMAMVSNFLFVPLYPAWALALIAIDGLALWALCRQLSHPQAV